jgi:hypothetical protein
MFSLKGVLTPGFPGKINSKKESKIISAINNILLLFSS